MTDSALGSRFAPPPPHHAWMPRLVGAGLVIVALLMLCCLFTYNAQEVSWSVLNPSGHEKAAEIPCTNMLGVFGMYLAGIAYYLLGAAAVYSFSLILVPAVGMVWRPEQRRTGQWIALITMALTACAILSIQPWVLVKWAEAQCISTPGGKLGYFDGECVAEALLGKYWALALLLVLHAVALIYFARLTPGLLYRAEKEDIVGLWQRWRERRRQARAEKESAARSWQKPFVDEAQPVRPDSWQVEPPRPLMPERQRVLPLQEDFEREEPPARRTPAPQEPQLRQPMPERRPVAAPQQPPVYEQEPPPAPQPMPRPPLKAAPRPVAMSHGDNLLDLMEPVEDEIERENSGDVEYEPMPMNRHLQESLNRHMRGQSPAPAEPRAPLTPRAPLAKPAPAKAAPALPAKAAPAPPPSARYEAEESDYPLPPYEMLNYETVSDTVREAAAEEMLETQSIIADTLEAFRISVQPGDITRGPSVTRYEFAVPRGLSVKAVAGKSKDIMAATQSRSVNILAPIPGKSTVGVELENSVKEPVYLRELLQSDAFHSPKVRIPVALGKDVYGNPVIGDLASMPHVLVAGSTGSGKSVCINSMLVSFLYKFRPDELKLILVDPKVVEMQPYKKLPHLAVPVVTDPTRVIGALRWAVNEMEHRYKLFSTMGVRNLEDYNNLPPDAQPVCNNDEDDSAGFYSADSPRAEDAIVRDIEDSQGCDIPDEEEEEQGEFDFHDDGTRPTKMPYIVIVIDELADLMMQVKEDLELYIGRLTAKARAAGIHMIIATQSPRAQVVTGIIKTNLPCRIALKVSSLLDSRVILDEGGAENLLGRGDLLYLPPGGPSKMARAQGAFVSDAEIASIIRFCASHAKQSFVQSAAAALSNTDSAGSGDSGGRGSSRGSEEDEELYTRCVNLVVTERKASTSLLQRRFSIGYGRAAKMMDLMEDRGVISPPQGANRAREVLIDEP